MTDHNQDDASRLTDVTRRALRAGEESERKRSNRKTMTDRVAELLGEQPWPGYNEQGVDAIMRRLGRDDAEAARRVKTYEQDHKNRRTVIQAASRRIDRT
jgi:hypothetical protein